MVGSGVGITYGLLQRAVARSVYDPSTFRVLRSLLLAQARKDTRAIELALTRLERLDTSAQLEQGTYNGGSE